MSNEIQNYFKEHKYLVVADPDFMPNLPLYAEIWPSNDEKYFVIPGQDVAYPEFREVMRNYHLTNNRDTIHYLVRNYYLVDGTRRCCKTVMYPVDYELTGLEHLYKYLSDVSLTTSPQEPAAGVKSAMVILDGKETWICSTPDTVKGLFEDIVGNCVGSYDPALAITYRN